jgi:H/ACA ribonucleoprotein complex non-core subunit NAF1
MKGPKTLLDGKPQGKEVAVSDDKLEMMDEFEDGPSISSYAKFKTQNEIDPEQIEKYAPPMPELDDLDQIVNFGVVANYIDDGPFHSVCLVRPNEPRQIFDLDNIVALGNKEVIGFVLDLVGHITMPQYSVRLYPDFLERIKSKGVQVKNQLVDQKVFLVQKCLKVINAKLPEIMSKKGCDASNIYDEEVPEHDQEYSDDEKEKEAKKARKKKRGNR